jgi:ubiquitin C-terminal hydrolase
MESSQIYAGNKGVANLGNTCYMNSVLQCLSHLLTFHPLNTEFFDACNFKIDHIMNEWFQFQRKMWSNEKNTPLHPGELLKMFQNDCLKYDTYFENFEQNDADEFLIIFLDFLHKCIRCTLKANPRKAHPNEMVNKLIQKSNQTWLRFYEKDYSYIVENFYSQLLSITTCPKCGYYTTNHDPVQVISLEIPNGAQSLNHCLDGYTGVTQLDSSNLWKCDKCHKDVHSEKKIVFWKTSDILILSLKRFKLRRKINTYLSFPEILDLDNYSLNYSTKKKNKYALQGLAIHQGSLGGGHYYAICKNPIDKKWRKYNDTHCNLVDYQDVQKECPYLLFYKRY